MAVVFLASRRDSLQRARTLKRVGLGVLASITAFFGLFVAAETITVPGGWKGARGVSAESWAT